MDYKTIIWDVENALKGKLSIQKYRDILLPVLTLHYALSTSQKYWEESKKKFWYYLAETRSLKDLLNTSSDIDSVIALAKDLEKQALLHNSGVDKLFPTDFWDFLHNAIDDSEHSFWLYRNIVSLISQFDLDDYDFWKIYQYIDDHAKNLGKIWWEFSTPPTISKLMVSLVARADTITSILDPLVGWWSLLTMSWSINSGAKLYGYDINENILPYALMQSLLNNDLARSEYYHKDILSLEKESKNKYDLIISEIPFWEKITSEQSKNLNQWWYHSYWSIADGFFVEYIVSQLSDTGQAIILVPNYFLLNSQETKLRNYIVDSWLLKAVISLPWWIFNDTSAPTSLLVFDKAKVHDTIRFIDPMEEFQSYDPQEMRRRWIKKYLSDDWIQSIYQALYWEKNWLEDNQIQDDVEDVDEFLDSRNTYIKTSHVISVPVSQVLEDEKCNLHVASYVDIYWERFSKVSDVFPNYTVYTIADVLEKDESDWTKALYFLKDIHIDLTKMVLNKEDLEISDKRGQRSWSISLNAEIVSPEYLQYYFTSKFWQYSLEDIHYRRWHSIISRVGAVRSIKDLKEIRILVPSLEDQENILQAHNKLTTIIDQIEGIKEWLATNPSNAVTALSQSAKILDSLDLLSDSDQILELIRRGEDQYLEFKETFEYNEKAKKPKDPELLKSALKNVVAFLNTEWGILLIGVSDRWEVVWIDRDLSQHKNTDDELLKHVYNRIRDYIWTDAFSFIKYKIVNIGNKKILRFDCSRSNAPCFFKDEEFFVRVNPAAQLLKGRAFSKYIRDHFSS